MRHRPRLLPTLILLALTLPGWEGCGSSHDDTDQCTMLAAEYAAALPGARTCTPAAPDPCGAQRPLPVYEQHENGQLTLVDLCNSGGGYVNPARTAALDASLARYSSAGCAITYCPGPLPHDPVCTEDTGGTFSCK